MADHRIDIPWASATPAPQPLALRSPSRRHYYTCEGETFSWNTKWYTEPFFTSSRASYDSAASLGPVNPPESVWTSAEACRRIQSSESASTAGAGATYTGAENETVSETTSRGSRVTTFTSSVGTTSIMEGATVLTTVLQTFTLTIPASASSAYSLSALPKTLSSTHSSSVSSSTGAMGPDRSAIDPSSINACTGDWDWQAWGAIAGLGLGFILAVPAWLLWISLRGRMPALYSPRSWFIHPDARPSPGVSLLALLLPFLHLPSLSETPSEGSTITHIMLSSVKLASILSVIALAGILPLILVGTPCLAGSAPSNSLGGRLGTLTDLSLLRLLNALDPSPDSATTASYLGRLVFKSPPNTKRNLPSTIAPAIDGARVRLIILLAILAVATAGGGLFVIARTYAMLMKSKRHFEEKTCEGLDLVFIPASCAPGWLNLSEDGLRKLLRDTLGTASSSEIYKETEVDALGVFAVPDTTELAQKVKEREAALMELEKLEAQYIASGKPAHTIFRTNSVWRENELNKQRLSVIQAPGRPPQSPDLGTDNTGNNISVLVEAPTSASNAQAGGSRFHEINRDSAIYGGRFAIGQRIRVDENGLYVADTSPDESDSTHPSWSESAESEDGEASDEDEDHMRRGTSPISVVDEPVTETSPSQAATPASPPHSGEALQETLVTAICRSSRSPSPSHLLSAPPNSRISSPTHLAVPYRPSCRLSGASSLNNSAYLSVRECCIKLKELNAAVEKLQQMKFGEITQGGIERSQNTLKGWLTVGRGLRWLPGAEMVEGRTRYDIRWENMRKEGGSTSFRLKVGVVGVLLGIFMIPCAGLTVGAAPGFAHYLGFLAPLRNSNGFGSGVAEGLVPAIAISLATIAAIHGFEGLSRQVQCISTTRRKLLAYKATFWILLLLAVIWLVLVASLEYAVQGFTIDVQKARTIGDGAIFSTWFVFVLLLNLALVSPALYLLQPKRLLTYLVKRKGAVTPRQRFRSRLPPSYTPSYSAATSLSAVFYACTLLFVFPLLSIPIVVMLYLSLVAHRYMSEHVFIDYSGGYIGILAGLWTIRRFGWVLPIQPALYGLILLSRNEWALGGVGLGVAVAILALSEILTIGRFPPDRREQLAPGTRQALDNLGRSMTYDAFPPGSVSLPSRETDLSILRQVATLLPGYSRLPPQCPLPLRTEAIDDLFATEQAAFANPALKESPKKGLYHETSVTKGLLYPPEMLAPQPVIWLLADAGELAEREVAEMGRRHGFAAIVDPVRKEKENTKRRNSSKRTVNIGDAAVNGGKQPGLPVLG